MLLGLFLVPQLFGAKWFSVVTPSMAPAYPPGTLLLCVPAPFEEIQAGDVICFSVGSAVVTHRVAQVQQAAQQFTTKGDANPTADAAPVLYRNVKGKVRFALPFAGKVFLFLQAWPGKILLVALLGADLLLYRTKRA